MAKFDIVPYEHKSLSDCATLFLPKAKAQRQQVPILPESMENPSWIEEQIQQLFSDAPAMGAMENNQVVGYLGGWIIPSLRGAGKTGVYCPTWAHATIAGMEARVYQALYRAAVEMWDGMGCQVHALGLLANDLPAREIWFWNGFGLSVVDAIRPAKPIGGSIPSGVQIRMATLNDIPQLQRLEGEFFQHFQHAPVLMIPPQGGAPTQFEVFMERPVNSIWLADLGDGVAAYMQFEGQAYGATEIVRSDTTIAITAAFNQPKFRGSGLARALVDAVLQHYASLGFTRCSVGFESFNPEAVGFWLKHFKPVCLSVLRYPEIYW